MNARTQLRALAGAMLMLMSAAAGRVEAREPKQGKEQGEPQTKKPADNYDELFARYLSEARATESARPAADQWGWMNGLALDNRARRQNDLISVRVEESTTASGTADSSISKQTNTANGIGGLFGVTKLLPSAVDPTALINTKNDNGFKGSGATNRAGTLTTLMTARVAEVLPSGDLIVEGVKEIDINGEHQIVVLTGVVRVVDINPGNVISSNSIGQLRIRYFGQGLMKDSLNPGWLLRILNKVF
jgi:flagellar L-ring protein FlgH